MEVKSCFQGVDILVLLIVLINGVKAETTNVALNKTVTSKSVFPSTKWDNLSDIVDGDLRRDGEACACCAATNAEVNPWITVDFGKEFWIENVVVYGRTDDSSHLYQSYSGLQLYFTNTPVLQGDAFYTVEESGWIDFVNVSVEGQLGGRYVTLLLKGTVKALPVCELEVYGSACKTGTYGLDCKQICGHCYNEVTCNAVTGMCTRCAMGYKDALCKTACDPGTFGQDCSSYCGLCYGNAICDPVTGACDTCMAGFKGLTCLSACDNGMHGVNCRGACGPCFEKQPCNKVDGKCERCDPGFLGDICDRECVAGSYGLDGSNFGGFSRRYESCNHTTGLCSSGCAAGRQGDACKQACEYHTFGMNCSQQCHCGDGKSFDLFSGECEDGVCAEGFFGDGCQQINVNDEECSGRHDVRFIGVVSGLVFIIIVLIVLVVIGLCFLKKRKLGESSKGETMTTACDNGTYGVNCRWACGPCFEKQSCNKVDGKCERCDPGYLGDICDRECVAGSYGQDCSTSCGFCRRYEPCNHTTGLCSSGCAAGRQGDACKQACENNTFGMNCSQQCHCGDGKSCDLFSGECEDGVCAEGFFGDGCQQINVNDEESSAKQDVMFIGVVSGLVFIIIVLIVLVVIGVCFLKRRKLGEAFKGETMTTGEHTYDDLQINENQL